MIELQTLVDFLQIYSYSAVFGVLILCGLGLPIPEDISLVAGGIISGLGYADVNLMFAICMVGVLAGDSIVYNIGKHSGPRFMASKMGQKLTNNKKYPMIETWFTKYGRGFLFAARFMPGLRAPIFFYAGATRVVSFRRFLIIDGTAAFISVPLWVFLGYTGANNREWLMDMIHRSQFGFLIALVAAVLFFLFMKFFKNKAFALAKSKGDKRALAAATAQVSENNIES